MENFITVKPLLSGHPRKWAKWSRQLHRGWPLNRGFTKCGINIWLLFAISNAVAIARVKSGKEETHNAYNIHPKNVTEKVIGHVPELKATWLSKFLKRPTNCGIVVIKGKRVNRGGGYGLEVPWEYPLEGDSFSCSLLQAKLIEGEFDLRCGGSWKAYILAQKKPLSLLILVFKYIMLCLMSCWKKLDMVHISS